MERCVGFGWELREMTMNYYVKMLSVALFGITLFPIVSFAQSTNQKEHPTIQLPMRNLGSVSVPDAGDVRPPISYATIKLPLLNLGTLMVPDACLKQKRDACATFTLPMRNLESISVPDAGDVRPPISYATIKLPLLNLGTLSVPDAKGQFDQ